ncbi:MAG: HAMP domain-containing protein, partial [Candidatus Omnitrophota bacterium]|nr:HAMP domain-containing protein [Candidatus Omnitrophota bacterium]
MQIALLMYVFFTINRQHEQVMHKQCGELEGIKLINSLQLALAQMIMPANDYLILGGATNEPENFKIIDSKTRDLIEKLNGFGFSGAEEKRLLKHIEKRYYRIKEIALQIFIIPNAIGNIEAGRLMEEMDKIADDTLRDAEMFYEFVRQDMGETETEMQKVKVFFDLAVLAGILFNIVFISLSLFFFRRTISLPLTSIRKVVLEIGRGNLDARINIRSNDEFGDLAGSFNEMVKNLQETQGVLQRNYEMQTVLNKLLHISLQNISMEEMLVRFIGQITSITWLTLESKGAIFLTENDPHVLILKAQQGLAAPLQKICAQVPFGRCLCGRAALSGEIVFTDHIDEHHENRYEGILPHGHYCIPIMSADKKALGVINLYTKEGRCRETKVEEFLSAIANVLTGVIERKKIDESLKTAYTRLQETIDQLIQAEKLNAIGQLASGVAHEVRNPLGIILQGVEYIEMNVPHNKDADQAFSMIKDSIRRADNIISLLFDFSKAAQLDLKPEDIASILESSSNLVQAKIKFAKIDIVKETQKDMPKALVDRNRM